MLSFKDPTDEFRSIFGYRWLIGRDLLPAIDRFAKLSKGVMLDIGCGDKPYEKIFLPNVNSYIGIDLPRLASKADMYSDALHLPFKDKSIDSCLSIWVLDDLAEPKSFFAEVARVLKPNGLWMMVECQNFPIHNPPWDYYRFTKYGLAYLAENAGFKVEEIKPMGGFWAAIGVLLVTSYLRSYIARFLKFSVRILYAALNLLFYTLDRLHFVERATYGYCVLLMRES